MSNIEIPSNFDSSNYIFDLAPFPMWIYDLKNYEFLAVNQEAIRNYGYTEEEFLTMTIKDIRPKEDLPKLEEAVKDVRQRKELYKQSLYRHTTKDKRLIYVKIKGNLITFRGKKAEIVTAIDLTDQYQQEKRLEEQKEYLKTIGQLNEILLKSEIWSDSLEQCFQIIGKFLEIDRVYFYQNDAKYPTTSQRFSWVNTNQNFQINNPELQKIPFSRFPLFMEPLQKGSHFEAIVSNLPSSNTKDRLSQQNVQSILVLPVQVNNNFSGFIGIEDCRQERKWKENDFQLLKALTSNLGHLIKEGQAHTKLINNEARFRSLVQNGTDLIAIITPAGDFKYVAPTTIKVLGTPPDEFIGKNVFDFIHKEDAARLNEYLSQILKKKYISSEPYRFQDAQENWRWIQTDLTNHLSDPAIEGIVANTRDVTAQVEKRLSEKLLISLTKDINQPGSLANCLSHALNKLVKLTKICVSEVWLVSEDDTRLDLISSAYKEDKFESFYHKNLKTESFEKGNGLPGYIWKHQQASIWDSLAEDNRFVRTKTAKSLNFNTAIGVPIFYNEKFLGCLLCISQSEKPQLLDQVNLLKEVGMQMGAIIKQKHTEEQYQNFLDISPDPHCIVGFDGLLKKYNKAFGNLLGYNKTELLNYPIFHLLHEDDKTVSEESFKSYIRGNYYNSFEARFLNKNGKEIWLVWNRSVLSEAKIIIAVAKDITQEKKAQEELRIAYDRLKTAQKIAKIGYWIRNFDSDVTEWSEETYKIYGYSPNNFVPTMYNVTQTFHPDDRHLIEGDPIKNLKPGKVEGFEHRILTANNEIKWVHQEIRLLTDKNKNPIRIEGTIQDITEKKEYELQLKISNERFQFATQASNEMIWEIDHQNNTMTRSEGYEKLIEYDKKESFTKNNSWFNSIHSQDIEDVWNSLQKALLDKQETSWYKEYKIYSREGSLAFLVDRCYIVRNEKGEPIRTVGSALDVTTSRQQIEKIKQQNKNLREIAWVQSHLVRAPLSSILGLIYLAKETDKNEESFEEILDMLSDSAEELDKVIHDIVHRTEKLQNKKS